MGLKMIDIIINILLVVLGVFFVVVLAVCAIAPLFISKDSTTGRKPLVRLGEGRGQAK